MAKRKLSDALSEYRSLIGNEPDPISKVSLPEYMALTEPFIRRACAYFKLDHRIIKHRIFLLHALSSICFSKQPRRGRPRNSGAWSEARLLRLALDAAKVNQDSSRLAAAAEIKRAFAANYRDASVDTIRRRLPSALRLLQANHSR